MKRVGILTSGGDCSGMNAAIRAAVRTALRKGVEVYGFYHGFMGILTRNYKSMESKDVSNCIQRGGTILQSARCEAFKREEGQKEVLKNLEELGVEGLIVIGGDGSLRGAQVLSANGVPVIGIPASIDNDIYGTDMSLGVDTALNVILFALDAIKDTASSHGRAFIVEVMGRNSGYLAITSALTSGAEAAIIPELRTDWEKLIRMLEERYKRGMNNCLIIVAEGAASAIKVKHILEDRIGYEVRITVLGHIQRGGAPTSFDRLLGTEFGIRAADALLSGESGKVVGLKNSEYYLYPLVDAAENIRSLPPRLLNVDELFGIQ